MYLHLTLVAVEVWNSFSFPALSNFLCSPSGGITSSVDVSDIQIPHDWFMCSKVLVKLYVLNTVNFAVQTPQFFVLLPNFQNIFAALARRYFHMRGKKNSKKPTKSQNLGVEFDTLSWFLAKVFWIEKYFHVFYSSKSPWNHHLSCKMIEMMWCFKCTSSSLGNFSMERRNWSLFCERWCSNSRASSIRSTDLSRQSKEDVAYQP